MKTTLNIDPELMRRVKIRAAQEGVTMTSVVEHALQAALDESLQTEPYRFDFPSAPGGYLVDVADRDALHAALDEPG